jgi:hypothetical protein
MFGPKSNGGRRILHNKEITLSCKKTFVGWKQVLKINEV